MSPRHSNVTSFASLDAATTDAAVARALAAAGAPHAVAASAITSRKRTP